MLVRGWVFCLGMVMGGGAFGQQAGPGVSVGQTAGAAVALEPATSVAGVLRGLASRAGVVFVGQVQSIVPKEGVVEVTFTVQQPVLGAVGGTYVLREWAGRWTGGQQRYRVGQRAMFFLHAPSAAGLSSPVDGMAGVVPVIPMGADMDPLLDVRLLAARVVRPVGSRMVDAELGALALSDARSVVTSWRVVEQTELVERPLPVGVRPVPVAMPTVQGSVMEQGRGAEQSGEGQEANRAQR